MSIEENLNARLEAVIRRCAALEVAEPRDLSELADTLKEFNRIFDDADRFGIDLRPAISPSERAADFERVERVRRLLRGETDHSRRQDER